MSASSTRAKRLQSGENKRSSTPKLPDIILDPVEAAKAAGLHYTSDQKPGIQRLKSGKGVRFVDAEGKAVQDKDTLARIKSLVIPPAWTDVWISKDPLAHLQCTGRDARGRKQSRYHPHWRQTRDATKYERMALFAEALPRIRKQVDHDLALPGLPRKRILATIVRLMEETLIRVGNEEYARENKSFGLTTLRNRHVEVSGAKITFDFQGKSRVHHTINLQDRRLAKIIQRCEEIPGYELFQYLDPEGHRHAVDSADVNEYLREITGEHFTAKDFRTWAGSVLACDLLRRFQPFGSASEAKKNVVAAIKQVAERLGNTPSVCRKCYIHPTVLESYLAKAPIDAGTREQLKAEVREVEEALHREQNALRQEERTFLELIGSHLKAVA